VQSNERRLTERSLLSSALALASSVVALLVRAQPTVKAANFRPTSFRGLPHLVVALVSSLLVGAVGRIYMQPGTLGISWLVVGRLVAVQVARVDAWVHALVGAWMAARAVARVVLTSSIRVVRFLGYFIGPVRAMAVLAVGLNTASVFDLGGARVIG